MYADDMSGPLYEDNSFQKVSSKQKEDRKKIEGFRNNIYC